MTIYYEQQESPRIEQARQTMTELTNELTSSYARFYQFSAEERARIIRRLVDLRAAVADAADEYRRARCGAPPRFKPYSLDQKNHGGHRPGAGRKPR